MGLFGAVHGHVGVLEQFRGVVAVLGIDRDPDAGVQVEGDPVDAEGLLQRHAQLVGHRAGSLGSGARQQDGELVPAEPGDGVGFPQRPCEPLADLDEEQIAMMVAEGVVDLLEPVQVQQQQYRRAELPVGVPDGLADAVGEQLPVG
jgi:hypothetical protein